MQTRQTTEICYQPFVAAEPANAEYVNTIIDWSSRESMVPITRELIAKHDFQYVAFAADNDRQTPKLAGYCAITTKYTSSIVELGGLVVAEEYRGLGVGSNLTRLVVAEALSKMRSIELIIAFSNKHSAKTFLRLGGERIADANSLPDGVWKKCSGCRFKPGEDQVTADTCCGRVFDITNTHGVLQ